MSAIVCDICETTFHPVEDPDHRHSPDLTVWICGRCARAGDRLPPAPE